MALDIILMYRTQSRARLSILCRSKKLGNRVPNLCRTEVHSCVVSYPMIYFFITANVSIAPYLQGCCYSFYPKCATVTFTPAWQLDLLWTISVQHFSNTFTQCCLYLQCDDCWPNRELKLYQYVLVVVAIYRK